MGFGVVFGFGFFGGVGLGFFFVFFLLSLYIGNFCEIRFTSLNKIIGLALRVTRYCRGALTGLRCGPM